MATSSDIYKKSGKTNFREKKMINELREAIDKKMSKDPSFRFSPAADYDELKALHGEYCIDNVAFEETKDEVKDDPHTKFRKEMEDSVESEPAVSNPMNEANPNVRDYVMEDKFAEGGSTNNSSSYDFKEPTTTAEAFDFQDTNNPQPGQAQTQSQGGQKAQPGTTAKKPKQEPFNPNFDDMSNKVKNKNTKIFATYVAEGASTLVSQAFVMFTTRNITDAKLAEYEMSGEMDLSSEVTLPDGQSVTSKEFLMVQRQICEQAGVITEPEKADLKDAITDVMNEKGFTPTPMQRLGMIGLSIGARLGITAIQINRNTQSILEQLRANKASQGGGGQQPYREPEHITRPQPAPQPQPAQPTPQPQQTQAPAPEPEPDPAYDSRAGQGDLSELDMNANGIIEGEIATKE
jgi:hypothetical protein